MRGSFHLTGNRSVSRETNMGTAILFIKIRRKPFKTVKLCDIINEISRVLAQKGKIYGKNRSNSQSEGRSR